MLLGSEREKEARGCKEEKPAGRFKSGCKGYVMKTTYNSAQCQTKRGWGRNSRKT
jgi:hypothetical protein